MIKGLITEKQPVLVNALDLTELQTSESEDLALGALV